VQLLQHILPQLLNHVPDGPLVVVPVGAVRLKSVDPFSAILAGLGGIVNPIAGIINAPGNNRTAQMIAGQQTRQFELQAMSSAEARAQQLTVIKYIVPAALLGLILILIFR